MGEEEQTTINAISKKMDIALGAFISFSVAGLLLGGIATYYMSKMERNESRTLINEKEIAVIQSEIKSNGINHDRRFQMIEKVVFPQ